MNTLPLRPHFEVPKFDPDGEKEAILSRFDLNDIAAADVFGNRILVAKWIRENVGSIRLSAQTQREDRWQGKVGVVLAVGPLAFEDDNNNDWRGQRAKVGDWVLFSYGDGLDFDYSKPGSFDKVPCKLLREGEIAMILPRPDFAY